MGYIKGHQLPSGTILVEEDDLNWPSKEEVRCIIYARVSEGQEEELEKQVERLKEYASKRGYKVVGIVQEVGPGVGGKRKKLLEALQRDDYEVLLIEREDRLSSVCFEYLQALLQKRGKRVESAYLYGKDDKDLASDLLAVVRLLLVKLYGTRKASLKLEKIKEVVFSED